MKHNRFCFAIFTFCVVFCLASVPCVSFATDEVIIPGKISWSIVSIDEVYKIERAQTVTEETENLYTSRNDKTITTEETGGTSVDSSHKVRVTAGESMGLDVNAGAGVGLKFGFIPYAYAKADANFHANAYASVDYDYNRHRQYWNSSQKTEVNINREIEENTRKYGRKDVETRSERRLRVSVRFCNNTKQAISFDTRGTINVYLGRVEPDNFLGVAHCTAQSNKIHLRRGMKSQLYSFELPLNDTDVLPRYDANKGTIPLVVSLSEPDVTLELIEKGNDPNDPDSAIAQNASEPYAVFVATPAGVRMFEIRTLGEPISLGVALSEITQHVTKVKLNNAIPVQFKLNATADALTSLNDIATTPTRGASAFLAVKYNDEVLLDWSGLLKKMPQPGDKIVFCVIDSWILTKYLPFNSPASEILREYKTQIEKWEKEGFVPEMIWRVNACKVKVDYERLTRKVLVADGIEYAFRWCPAGTCTMGSPKSEEGRFCDETHHEVTLTKGFWMLETEVTQAMWESVMGSNPSYFKGKNLPVENVSWNDCQEFCQKLSSKLGVKITLPTEAQWEYACRAGTTGDYAGDLDEMAWYGNNSDSKTHAVGTKKPNAWGLYDMHGNVWEWCSDWYGKDYYDKSPTSDPIGATSGPYRVNRGGSWSFAAQLCRSACRCYFSPGTRGNSLGYRLTFED